MSKAVPIFFIVVALGILIFLIQKTPSLISGPSGQKQYISTQTTPTPTHIYTGTPNPYSGMRPETVILSGPQNGAVIDDDIEATFYFAAIWPGDLKNISFETKLSGVDADWQTTYGNSRTIRLLSGDKNYLFQVRAKTSDGIYDLTPAQRSFEAKISSYLDKVQITSASPGQYPYSIMRITLSNSGSDVDISGWTLQSYTVKYSIPTGTNLYNPASPGASADIIFKSGDYLTIIGQPSPIGANYRWNKCLGYLNYSPSPTPTPNFDNNCPTPDNFEISNLSISCQNYVRTLWACQIPTSADITNYDLDSQCQNFITNRLNYSGCVNRYRYDSDFSSRNWYVYSGNNFLLPDHDKLILRDSQGAAVDFYSY